MTEFTLKDEKRLAQIDRELRKLMDLGKLTVISDTEHLRALHAERQALVAKQQQVLAEIAGVD